MHYLDILVYSFLSITVAHSYLLSTRFSISSIEPSFINPYLINTNERIEELRIHRNNKQKFFISLFFLILALVSYGVFIKINIQRDLYAGITLLFLLSFSLLTLWYNIKKIESKDFGHKILNPKQIDTTSSETLLVEVAPSIQALNKVEEQEIITLTSITPSLPEFKKETKQSLKSRKRNTQIRNHLTQLTDFLDKLEGFKYFNIESKNFSTLKITTLRYQKNPPKEEIVWCAVLAFFFLEVVKKESYLSYTPTVFYEPINKFIANNGLIIDKSDFSDFRVPHINESGLEEFLTSEFYQSLLLHYKKTL